MMRIAVTWSMDQVATSLIEQAGREFEIILLGRRVFFLEDRGLFSLGAQQMHCRRRAGALGRKTKKGQRELKLRPFLQRVIAAGLFEMSFDQKAMRVDCSDVA
jgi:hypothetical protein